MRRPSIDPSAFEDDVHLHTKCGYHVQMVYYVHSVIAVFMDLIPIVIGLLLFIYPEFHRQSAVYPQFFQTYDRIYAYQYYIIYNSIIFMFILLHFFCILSIGISIFGIKLRKPYLILPQLILLIFRIGILVLLFCALMTFNFVGSELAIFSTLVIFLLLIFAGTYLVSTVFCFRFVYEKYEVIQQILASAKSVHFKKKSKRRK